MLKILKEKMVALGRGEEGVAMVVTLGIFMFLYVTCASVYAVGMAVREKLHLQGACDAAAYSAAIVQADTFSRIATINRAMSWTYQQMTKRQMDYVVWQWLEEVVEHHAYDLNAARQYAWNRNRCTDGGKCRNARPCYGQGVGWDCSDISLEGSTLRGPYTEGQLLGWARTGFSNALRSNAGSFYSRRASLDDLGDQIDDDLRNIYDMSEKVDELARNLPTRIHASASAILKANIPVYMSRGDCQYCIRQEDSPRTRYFRTFRNTAYDETIFLSLGNSVIDPAKAFGTGADTWFVRGDGRHQEGTVGIHRSYDHTRQGPPLRANWTWWATGWTCGTTGPHHWRRVNGFDLNCPHSHDKCFCASTGRSFSGTYVSSVTTHAHRRRNSTWYTYTPNYSTSVVRREMLARCSADSNSHAAPYGAYDNAQTGRYDNRFKGHLAIREGGRLVEKAVTARPLKLTQDYFGSAGTITVGLARRSENPWFSLFGRVTGGLYSAFSPVANSWSFCFASAKAGYKLYHEPDDWYANLHLGSQARQRLDVWEDKLNGTARVANGPRDYCVDWKSEESKFAGWYWTYKTDEDGNEIRDANGNRIRDRLVTEWTDLAQKDLYPTWRQSWNLVQDDWDAVMVPVRQGGSSARETENYSLRQWWDYRLSGRYGEYTDIPHRYEATWQGLNRNHLAGLVNGTGWISLSGNGLPDARVTAGASPSGTAAWKIGHPGQRLNWGQVGDEMFH